MTFTLHNPYQIFLDGVPYDVGLAQLPRWRDLRTLTNFYGSVRFQYTQTDNITPVSFGSLPYPLLPFRKAVVPVVNALGIGRPMYRAVRG